MSTLVQIESAVTTLPPQDQWSLLAWLQRRLAQPTVPPLPAEGAGPEWLTELRALRAQCSTGKAGTPVEQLVTEIRS